jgi:hypothetical protein
MSIKQQQKQLFIKINILQQIEVNVKNLYTMLIDMTFNFLLS